MEKIALTSPDVTKGVNEAFLISQKGANEVYQTLVNVGNHDFYYQFNVLVNFPEGEV